MRAGALRARDVLEAHLDRIAVRNPLLNALCFLDEDAARRRADEVDAAVAAGEDPGVLAGVPLGVKELDDVAGWPATEASRAYADRVAAVDSVKIARLRAAGAVLVGLTTSSEFGDVSFVNTKLHGVTRSPWDPARTPGGSSGGSAAAVSGGLLPLCTGGDGGGSIRIPSSYCGLPGWKPTFGRIPAGPGPYNLSLTAVGGPIARSVRDCARFVDVTAGPSLTDPTSLPPPGVRYEELVLDDAAARGCLAGLRVGWSDSLGYAFVDPEVGTITRRAAELLVDAAGMEWVDVDVHLPRPGGSWGLVNALDLAVWHLDAARDRLDEITPVSRAGFRAILDLDVEVLLRAYRRRQALLEAAAGVFEQVDLLLTPTTPTPAFEAEGRYTGEVDGHEVTLMGLSAWFTAPFNLTGQPAMSIPAGAIGGLPVGLQVVARRHADELPLLCAALLERAQPWPKLAPEPADVTR